jgi:hypothetical protein
MARRKAPHVSDVILGVQSRGEVGWIVSEAAWIVCPGSAGRLVWREAA